MRILRGSEEAGSFAHKMVFLGFDSFSHQGQRSHLSQGHWPAFIATWETVVGGLKILEQGQPRESLRQFCLQQQLNFSVLAVCDVLPALSHGILLTALEGGHCF